MNCSFLNEIFPKREDCEAAASLEITASRLEMPYGIDEFRPPNDKYAPRNLGEHFKIENIGGRDLLIAGSNIAWSK